MVRGKSNSKIIGPSAYTPIELYTVSYMPFFPRGAKKEIRDENGNLLYNARNSRIVIGGNYTKEQADRIVNNLTEKGYKKVKAEKGSTDFPSMCPSCDRKGHPEIVQDNRFESKSKPYRLHYNHSTKPKTCYVGTVTLQPFQIKLKAGLPVGSLGFSRRVGTYSI